MRERSFNSLVGHVGAGRELHRFRHTCATEWLQAGMDLETVSKLLGYSNIKQTLCHAQIVREDVAGQTRARSRASPARLDVLAYRGLSRASCRRPTPTHEGTRSS